MIKKPLFDSFTKIVNRNQINQIFRLNEWNVYIMAVHLNNIVFPCFRYNQVCYPEYTFGSESAARASFFTQVVWKSSKELGFGKAESYLLNGMKCAYYLARYKKAGNIGGTFATNVLKGSFDENSYCSTIKRTLLRSKKL